MKSYQGNIPSDTCAICNGHYKRNRKERHSQTKKHIKAMSELKKLDTINEMKLELQKLKELVYTNNL
ncbi:MAG: hypothetical protein P4L60_19945 [Clostridium sp.]|nr:hypothetical protein [Clostridium sp.]